MKAPIHSDKHYIQRSLLTVAAGTIHEVLIAVARNIKTGTDSDVLEGAVIKAVFVEMWARGSETSPGSVLLTLLKIPDGQAPLFADMIALNDYTNKKNVFYHTQGLTNDGAADAIPFVRGWFKIPKGKQRFGLGDSLRLVVSAQALDTNICGFMTYKEYT